MIASKQVKNGTVKYSLSLLYRDWQEVEDYAVWKRRQSVVSIEESAEEESVSDEAPTPISKEAIRVVKAQTVKPGRATRPYKLTSGVASFKFQSTDSRVDLVHEAVIQSGCLIVSVSSKSGELAKGEEKRVERPVNPLPENPRKSGGTPKHPREPELISLFDPYLIASGSFPLLAFDPVSLKKACVAAGEMPAEFLDNYVRAGRGSRGISSTGAVIGITKDAHAHWMNRDRMPAAEVKAAKPTWDEMEREIEEAKAAERRKK